MFADFRDVKGKVAIIEVDIYPSAFLDYFYCIAFISMLTL